VRLFFQRKYYMEVKNRKNFLELKSKKKMNAVANNKISKAFGYVSGIEKRSKQNGIVDYNVSLQNFQQDLNLKVGDVVFIKFSKKLAEKYLKKKLLEGLLEKIELTLLDKTKFQISTIQKEFRVTDLLALGLFVAQIVEVKHIGSDITISGARIKGQLPPKLSSLHPEQVLQVGAVVFSLDEIDTKI